MKDVVYFRTIYDDHIHRINYDTMTHVVEEYEPDIEPPTGDEEILFAIPKFIDPCTHIGQEAPIPTRYADKLIASDYRASDSILNHNSAAIYFDFTGYLYCAISPDNDLLVGGSVDLCDVTNRSTCMPNSFIKAEGIGVRVNIGEMCRPNEINRTEQFALLREWISNITKKDENSCTYLESLIRQHFNSPLYVHVNDRSDIERVVELFENHCVPYVLVHTGRIPEYSDALLFELSLRYDNELNYRNGIFLDDCEKTNPGTYCRGIIISPLSNENGLASIDSAARLIMQSDIPVAITTNYPMMQPILGPLTVEMLIRNGGVPMEKAIDTITKNPAIILDKMYMRDRFNTNAISNYWEICVGKPFYYNLYKKNPFEHIDNPFAPFCLQ